MERYYVWLKPQTAYIKLNSISVYEQYEGTLVYVPPHVYSDKALMLI